MQWGRPTGDRQTWHDWFAWHPVRFMDGRRGWLERVQRCDYFADHIPSRVHFGFIGNWVYRPLPLNELSETSPNPPLSE